MPLPDFPRVFPFGLDINEPRFQSPPLFSNSPFSRASRPFLTSAMSFSTQAAARCARQLSGSVRPSSLRIATSATYLTARRTPSSRRCESTQAAPAAATNPKISQIVDQISTLTLLETADLVSSLKVCFDNLHITDGFPNETCQPCIYLFIYIITLLN